MLRVHPKPDTLVPPHQNWIHVGFARKRSLIFLGSANNTISETRSEIALGAAHFIREVCKRVFSKTGADLFGEAFKEVLVQKVETDSALSKAVSIVQGQRFFRDINTAERLNPAIFNFFFQGAGSVDTGTGRQDQFSVQNLMERGAHPRLKFCKESECSADWAPVKQSDANLQTNSKISRGPLQGAKASRPAAVLLAGMDQTDPRPLGIRDNQWLQDPILKPTTKYQNSSFSFSKGEKK